MNCVENGSVRESGKIPIPSYAIATSCSHFFQSAETLKNMIFVLILVPFDQELTIYGSDERSKPEDGTGIRQVDFIKVDIGDGEVQSYTFSFR